MGLSHRLWWFHCSYQPFNEIARRGVLAASTFKAEILAASELSELSNTMNPAEINGRN